MEQTMLEAMMSRKSVRSYTDQMVSDADIEKVLKAGQYAANGRGRMATKFVVVKNREIRDELSKMNAEIMGTTNDPFYGAPVVIWVLADRNVHTYVEDGSLAIGNMLLEAHALGLGACWIHRAKEMSELPEGRALLQNGAFLMMKSVLDAAFWAMQRANSQKRSQEETTKLSL